MRFFRTVATYLDRVVGFDLDCAQRLLVDEPDDRPKKEVGGYDERSSERARYQLASTGEGSDHCRAPKGCRSIEALHIEPLA